MVDKLVNSFSNGMFISYDLSTNCNIFSLHVALNAYYEEVTFSQYISMILDSFENFQGDYNEKDFVCRLNKVEKAYEIKDETDRKCVYFFDDLKVIRRHVLEYIIDGILHEEIHNSLISRVVSHLNTNLFYIRIMTDSDFNVLKNT